ncbi:MAG: hypothetical protein K9N21_10410 [Deltaproteobacteria bacterium]|nr:hypothetical protein [Deltaproteobacteria bacterium]
MYYFESLIYDAVERRHKALPMSHVAQDVGRLYEETEAGHQVMEALGDPFFPLTLYVRHYLPNGEQSRCGLARAGQNLALLSRMFLRIRKDIDRCFGNREATCVDLNGDARQVVPRGQWCTLCGECCQLSGTVPDAPETIRYPGYWYTYIAGDSPLTQKFCPFLWELPPQGLFICAIHNVKPLTCLAYGKEDCQKSHPRMRMRL